MNLKYQEIIFDWVLYLSWILYFTAYFGIMMSGPTHQEFMELLDTSMKYYISLFLIIRFNPFYKSNFTNFDRKVVFSAGIFLITTTALGQYANKIHFMEESMKFLHVIR